MWHPDKWPLRRSPTYLLRLGQAFVQLWRANGRGWEQIDSQAVHHLAHDQYQALADLLPSITQELPQGAQVQVLADSKWMPVSLLLTGSKPLSKGQLDVLAKHRFAQIFGEQANGWSIRTTYVAGDAKAMAFACPIGLLTSLRHGIEAEQTDRPGKHRLNGLAPTLSWAWDQVGQSGAGKAGAGKAGTWFVLAEQDRSILVCASKGQIQGLQPAGPTLQNPSHLDKVLSTEALRCGLLDEQYSVRGASFEPMPEMMPESPSDAFRWQVLLAQESIK